MGDEFNPNTGVTAKDQEDGDLTDKLKIIENTVDTSKAGVYKVVYKVTNSLGTSITREIKVTVKEKDNELEKGIVYQTHVEDIGWKDWKSNGEMAGTIGKEKRLEGIEIRVVKQQTPNIQYRTHIEDHAWQGWKSNGEMSGTSGESKRLEGIEVRIVKNK